MASADQWLDVEEIARFTGWTPAYVRKRSSIDGWRRAGTKPQKYDVQDVTRSTGVIRDMRTKKRLVDKYLTSGIVSN